MAYHTVTYLFVFLPLALCLYQLVPQRTRWIVLLFFGYLFVWTFNERMVLWLIGTSLFTHYICVWITWAREKNAYACKKILTFGIVLLLTAWGYVKYFDFFVANLNRISEVTELFPKVQTIEVLLPIGVSFYTLQAIGYMIDVGRQGRKCVCIPERQCFFLAFFRKSWKDRFLPTDRLRTRSLEEIRSE